MKKSLLLGICIIFLVFISGCTGNLGPPRIELSAYSFDLGDINPDEGIRTETFFVKNTGNSLLSIISVSTSCGCTEAEVESEGILPGEQTKLIVNYDPSVHPGLTGNIKRVVYVKSNDPLQEEVELELTGNILPKTNSGEEL